MTPWRRGHTLSLMVLALAAPVAADDAPPADSEAEILQVGLECIQAVLQASPDPDFRTLLGLGLRQFEFGQRDIGQQTVHRALERAADPGPEAPSNPAISDLVVFAPSLARYVDRDGVLACLRRAAKVLEGANPRQDFQYYPYLIEGLRDLDAGEDVEKAVRTAAQTFQRLPSIEAMVIESELVGVYMAAGDTTSALALVDQFEAGPGDDANRHRRVGAALWRVARGLRPRGGGREFTDPAERESAREVLDEVERRIELAGLARNRDTVLYQVARQRAILGDFEGADRAIRLAPGEPSARRAGSAFSQKMLTTVLVSEDQFRAGQADAARIRLRALIDEVASKEANSPQGISLGILVSPLCRIGDLEGATRCIEAMDPALRVEPLLELARARRKAGDGAGTRETLQRALVEARHNVEHPSVRPQGGFSVRGQTISPEQVAKADALKQLALVQIAGGDYETARETASAIEPAILRQADLRAVAEALAREGQARSTFDWLLKLGYPKAATNPVDGLIQGIAVRRSELGRSKSP